MRLRRGGGGRRTQFQSRTKGGLPLRDRTEGVCGRRLRSRTEGTCGVGREEGLPGASGKAPLVGCLWSGSVRFAEGIFHMRIRFCHKYLRGERGEAAGRGAGGCLPQAPKPPAALFSPKPPAALGSGTASKVRVIMEGRGAFPQAPAEGTCHVYLRCGDSRGLPEA
mgnify:CR=1 FL=1